MSARDPAERRADRGSAIPTSRKPGPGRSSAMSLPDPLSGHAGRRASPRPDGRASPPHSGPSDQDGSARSTHCPLQSQVDAHAVRPWACRCAHRHRARECPARHPAPMRSPAAPAPPRGERTWARLHRASPRDRRHGFARRFLTRRFLSGVAARAVATVASVFLLRILSAGRDTGGRRVGAMSGAATVARSEPT